METDQNSSQRIGLSSTIPVEIVYAAGLIPVDINNLFISDKTPERLISQAESAGFSHGICAWIKGIYSSVLNSDIKRFIAVTGGDCSNTIALSEILARRGVGILPFEFPFNRDYDYLYSQMDSLRKTLGTTWEDIESTKERLDRIRGKLKELDKLTYKDNLVTGFENHLYQVCSSDFNSDPDQFEKDLDELLIEINSREPLNDDVRLGYLGVPSVFSDFYEYIETTGGRVVFNEVQRQFTIPSENDDIVSRYLEYSYPYDIDGRIQDIRKAVEERQLDGLIHYTQNFCYRQLYDVILRESVSVPVLTLEGDRPGKVDNRTAIRLETFVEMLGDSI